MSQRHKGLDTTKAVPITSLTSGDVLRIDEISDRLRLVDGYVPREEIIQKLEGYSDLEGQRDAWRMVSVSLALLLVFSIAAGVYIYSYQVTKLGRGICASPGLVEETLITIERLSEVNARCIQLHEDNRQEYNAMLGLQKSGSGD